MRVLLTLSVAFYPLIFMWLGFEKLPVEMAIYILNISMIGMLNHVIYEIRKK